MFMRGQLRCAHDDESDSIVGAKLNCVCMCLHVLGANADAVGHVTVVTPA